MATKIAPITENKSPQMKPVAVPQRKSTPSLEQIRARAYQKYCARDGAPGDALHDWLDAEHELREPARDPAEHRERELKLLSAAEPDADPNC